MNKPPSKRCKTWMLDRVIQSYPVICVLAWLIFFCAPLIAVSQVEPYTASFNDADAERMFDAFNEAFYVAQSGGRAYYKDSTDGGHAWFWGQANMMEMVADAYDHAPSQDRRDRLAALCEGFLSYHGSDWAWNEYNDDILWACIVFTKAYRITENSYYRDRAIANFNTVWNRAWATSLGGGIYWKVGSSSRNACANSPAAIVACMLYDITGNEDYLDKARAIIAWMDDNLVQSNGAVDDNISSTGTVTTWHFTYNQGTYVGACSALYRITGEISYLENAMKATDYTRYSMCNSAGVFPNHGRSGDGGGFNGIGIRWIARMVRDQGLWDEYYSWLRTNAEAAWAIRNSDDLSWADWRTSTAEPPTVLYSFGCYGSVVALQVVPSVDPSYVENLTGETPTAVYEAEDALLQGGAVVASNVSGFRGTGFADYIASLGETITWTVNSEVAGNRWISFRYGNGGTTDRPVRLRVNGTPIQILPFSPTGSWKTWEYAPGVMVPLVSGSNTIQLSPTSSSAPNIDLLYVYAPPKSVPAGATVLFDGTQQSLDANWKRDMDDGLPSWTVAEDAMQVVQTPAPNDISTVADFRDYKLHLEWLAPPGGLGQEAANSGVILGGSYEIQILNTPREQTPWPYTAGAIQQYKAPDSNASLGAGHWQTYDIDFTAARWNGNVKTVDARMTVYWNGVLIHDNVEIPEATGDLPVETPGRHSILLQAHTSTASSPVRFRNVWVLPKTSEILEAESASLAGPSPESGNSGFSGNGYVDYGSTVGETITWNVETEIAGNHWISFRYANGGSDNRPLNLKVNGQLVRQLPFAVSGGWSSWILSSGVSVPLQAGDNTIQLVSTIAAGPNVDYLYVNAPPASAPPEAYVLFDGTHESLTENWVRDEDESAATWAVANDRLSVVDSPAGNDISTRYGFKDFKLHLEWLSPQGGSGQEAGNSGVVLQNGYEIQILNAPRDQSPAIDGAAAIMQVTAPDSNSSAGEGLWQTYDIDFTAARWNGSVKTSDARVSVYWNGVLVQDNVAIPGATESWPEESPGFHPLLLLADDGNTTGPVQFRNIWVVGDSAVLIPSTPGEFLSQWFDVAGVEGADRDPGQDPDGDGLANLWEYVCGGNPMVPDLWVSDGESRAPTMTFREEEGLQFVEFNFLRRSDWQERGIVFSAESTDALDQALWTTRTVVFADDPVPEGDGTYEWVKARVALLLNEEPRMFFRLKAELNND
ncbi:MAG: DUF1080 domain-containing protein [Pontiellaceae bacterium]|nr:DUF1080 domain-containing protein [Pontiellaceae bacterium]MBN2783696.1 DUF1080 domain-containing protein [Pontiellaceae bacterium]